MKDPKGDSATTRYRLAKLKILSSKLNELSFPALSPLRRYLIGILKPFVCFACLIGPSEGENVSSEVSEGLRGIANVPALA